MPELESLSQAVKDQLASVASADVVIGLTSFRPTDDLSWAAELAHNGLNLLVAYPGGGDLMEFQPVAGLQFLHYPVSTPERYLNTPKNIFGSFQDVLQIGIIWPPDPVPDGGRLKLFSSNG
jgi:hypothetical protein